MKKHLLKFGSSLRSRIAPIAAGATALVASPFAFAGGGGTSPGAAIAGELAGGAAELGLIFAAVAILLGMLLLWALSKRGAKA